MIVDDFMFHVSKIWYRIYWSLLVVINVAIVGLTVLTRTVPGFQKYGDVLYIGNDITLALSAITLVYLLGFYWFALRIGVAMANLIGTMINSLVFLNGINNTTGTGKYVFIGLWIATTWLNGIYGIPVVLGSALVSCMIVLLESDFHPMSITPQLLVLLIGSLAAAVLSWLFWRGRFESKQAQQMDRLSGMLRSNQEQSAILIQSIADGVIVINTEGKITLINPAAASMTQWPVSEAMGIDVQLVAKVTTEKGEELAADESPFTAVLTKKNTH